MTVKYIGNFKARLEDDHGDRLTALIWGDPVYVLEESGDRVRVRARARKGWVEASALSDQGLLECYVIDVGQGDSVLIRTPED